MNLNRRFPVELALLALTIVTASCEQLATMPTPSGRPAGELAGALRVVERTAAVSGTVHEVTLGSAGGVLHLEGGHSLHFPAGALAQPTTIRGRRDGAAVRIEFGPHGLVFPDSALPTLTLSYADGTGLDDERARDLTVVYLGGDGAILEVLRTEVDAAADVVRTRIRHFSTYALATD